MCPRPYDNRLPRMLTMPSIEYQAALRFVCSERLYHICTTAIKAGAEKVSITVVTEVSDRRHYSPTAASNAPNKNLVAIKLLKLVAPAMPHRMVPQVNTMMPTNLPIGNLTRKKATRGCMTSCAMYTMLPSHEYWSELGLRFASWMRPKTDAYDRVC